MNARKIMGLQPLKPTRLREGISNSGHYNAACTYGVLQMKPETLPMFRRSVEAGFGDLALAARDSDLACIHADPEFQKIIESHRPTA